MLLEISSTETIDANEAHADNSWAMPEDWSEQPATTTSEAVRRCRRLATALNAQEFSLFFCASQSETNRLLPVFDSSFPGVSTLSKSLSARAADHFARQAANETQPLWWSSEGTTAFLTDDARCWGIEIESPLPLTQGLALPVAIEHSRWGVLVFVGDLITMDEFRLCDLHARCFSLFSDVSIQRAEDTSKLPSTSKRELECLRLTADGLTSEDIAAALGLSVHTANQYLSNSTHKLNAVNRTHAVAKALRCGLID
jgi:DNA-binding CsgD family transcriptional regulator